MLVAVLANLLVAVAKTVASVLTGSASMMAEAVHSWVDLGNEGFLIGAVRTARRPADETHPVGYGRESFVWSLFASLGMLVLGSVATVWHGISQLGHHDAGEGFAVGYVVLAVSFVLEGGSFLQTLRQMRTGANARGRKVFDPAHL